MAYKIDLDISGDFEGVCNDFLDSAALRVDGVDTDLVNALTEPHEWKELEPTGGQVTRVGTMFVWSKSRSDRPPLGAIIIHDDIYWTIWRLTDKQHVECYEALCLNLNIITADDNVATVLKATYSHGDAGEAKATWRGLWSNKIGGRPRDQIAAHFQPSEETAELEFGGEYSKETYRVYFQDPVPMEAAGGEYRLVDSEGYRYRVVKYYQENRIDRLPVAIAVRITEGREYAQNPGPGA
jgi:hypothetical protein